MNRIDQKFKKLKKQKKKAFIAFITAGDPSLKLTEDLVLGFEKAQVDIVELGVPFSDPLADGPTIQASSQRALERGGTCEKILKSVANIRKKSDIPIALMTYYNPIFHFGEEKFVIRAKKAGVDGLVVPDLPPEEARDLIRSAKKHQLSLSFFLSPTTTPQRRVKVVKASSGFIYYVSLTGVTGERQSLPNTIAQNVRVAKKMTKIPICVGFGISNSAQVKSIAKVADGVIVGSAIIKEINKNIKKRDVVQQVTQFVAKLARGLNH